MKNLNLTNRAKMFLDNERNVEFILGVDFPQFPQKCILITMLKLLDLRKMREAMPFKMFFV